MTIIRTMRAKRAILAVAATVLVGAGGFASAAYAQDRPTPPNWQYDIQNGKRVPRTNRVSKPDGSWREEIRQGKCVTIKERSATGEYRETRQCDGSGTRTPGA